MFATPSSSSRGAPGARRSLQLTSSRSGASGGSRNQSDTAESPIPESDENCSAEMLKILKGKYQLFRHTKKIRENFSISSF